MELGKAISNLQNVLVAKGAKATVIEEENWKQDGPIVLAKKDNLQPSRRGFSKFKQLFFFAQAD